MQRGSAHIVVFIEEIFLWALVCVCVCVYFSSWINVPHLEASRSHISTNNTALNAMCGLLL